MKNSLLAQMLIPVSALLLVLAFLLMWLIPALMQQTVLDQVRNDAVETATQFKTIRGYYTKNVIAKAKAFGMKPHYSHGGKDNIPLPATFIHEVSAMLEKSSDINVKLYSPYPFPNRASRQLDEFADKAWKTLVANPKEVVSVREEGVNGPMLRVAIADTMQAQACVTCHNTHPQTPRDNWKLNDVRGVLEVVIPVAKAEAASYASAYKLLAVFLVVILAAGFIFWWLFNKRILGPVKSMQKTLAGFASGQVDLSERLPEDEHEVGRLAKSFNGFLEHMGQMISRFVQLSDSLKSNSNSMLGSARGVSQNVLDGSRDTESLVTALNQLAATSETMSKSAGSASDQSASAQQSVATADRSTQQNINTINELKAAVDEITDMIRQNHEKSQSIGVVLEVIQQIAEQTNLLALNAAIEAARAGDSGRGFAVVADEVRTLAQRTQTSTVEIQAAIDGLQASSTEATQRVDASREKIDRAVELADQVVTQLAEVRMAIDQTSDMSSHIAQAAHEQSSVVGELDRNMNHINDTSQMVIHEMDSLQVQAQEIEAVARQISDQLKGYR